nr:unnamed protein product [Spirometra erinaceieuropaei]
MRPVQTVEADAASLVGGEDHVADSARTAEAALTFRQGALSQMVVQATEKKSSEDLTGNIQKEEASVFVSNLVFPSAQVELNDYGAFEVLRDFSLTPHLLEERSQMIHELGAAVLVDLIRDRVRSRRFPARELLHGLDGFVERGQEF